MPDNPNNLDDNRDENPSFDEPSKPPKPTDKDSNDPFGIKSVSGGVLVLVLICGFLFVFAKLGQKGTSWIGDTVESALSGGGDDSDKSDEPIETSSEEKEGLPVVAVKKKKQPTEKPPKESTPALVIASDETPSQSARRQLLELLDPEIHEVRHIVFSEDKTAMVAAIRLLNEKELTIEEVYFLRDEIFPSYAPRPGSLLGEDIKVYLEE